MNNLNIGLAVNAMLLDSEALVAKVGSNIFPLVAKYDTKFPFITYQRRNVSPEYCKDMIVRESVSVELYVAAQGYAESVEIANLIREAMEFKTGIYGGVRVSSCRLAGSTETFYDGAYIQQITFNIVL